MFALDCDTMDGSVFGTRDAVEEFIPSVLEWYKFVYIPVTFTISARVNRECELFSYTSTRNK